jgi:hypoxanthine phosphoribosyltransferase
MSNHRSDYLDSVFDPTAFEGTVKRATEMAKAMVCKYKADTLAFQGNSGSALAYILGHALSLPLVLIRKHKEDSHYMGAFQKDRLFEGYTGVHRYIIVDDFYSSGSTIDRIIDVVKDNCPDAECVSLLMYNQASRRKVYTCKRTKPELQGKRLVAYSAHPNHWGINFDPIGRMLEDNDSDPEGYDLALRRKERDKPPTVEEYVKDYCTGLNGMENILADSLLKAKADEAYNYLRND